jgi:hypothetical protein
MRHILPGPCRALALLGLVLAMAGCGGGSSGGASLLDRDGTPTNRSSGPRPTADSPPLGSGGGPGVGDSIGSGGGITGSGGAAP